MNRRKHKLIVEYGKNGYTCSDFDIENDVSIWIRSEDLSYVLVSDESIIQQFKVEIAKGNIQNEDISFKFGDDIINPNKEGRLDHYPPGFGIMDEQLNILIGI